MPEAQIDVSDAAVLIERLSVPRREVAAFFAGVPEVERVEVAIRAIEVGVFCLERAQTAKDLDFVRRQIDSLLTTVELAVGGIPKKAEDSILAKLGDGDGQVLAPLKRAVENASNVAGQRVQEVKDLLSKDLDPSKDQSTLGSALRQIRELLDPKRTDSIQSSLNAAVVGVVAADGQLAQVVRSVVGDAIKPLANRVDTLTQQIVGQEAVMDALEQTTRKGDWFEEEVTARLQEWGSRIGIEVSRVGGDSSSGDVLVNLKPDSTCGVELSIVVEARDRQDSMGRRRITDCMNEAMKIRGADAGIYVSHTPEGLAREVADWAEGVGERGPWVACTYENLLTAARFLIVMRRLQAMQASSPEANTSGVKAQLERVRTALGRITTINTKAGNVLESANAIKAEANNLRDEMRSALAAIEDALRLSPTSIDTLPNGHAATPRPSHDIQLQ